MRFRRTHAEDAGGECVARKGIGFLPRFVSIAEWQRGHTGILWGVELVELHRKRVFGEAREGLCWGHSCKVRIRKDPDTVPDLGQDPETGTHVQGERQGQAPILRYAGGTVSGWCIKRPAEHIMAVFGGLCMPDPATLPLHAGGGITNTCELQTGTASPFARAHHRKYATIVGPLPGRTWPQWIFVLAPGKQLVGLVASVTTNDSRRLCQTSDGPVIRHTAGCRHFSYACDSASESTAATCLLRTAQLPLLLQISRVPSFVSSFPPNPFSSPSFAPPFDPFCHESYAVPARIGHICVAIDILGTKKAVKFATRSERSVQS